ncbi:MAG: lytic murein transglycosylase [Mycobacterium sp.]
MPAEPARGRLARLARTPVFPVAVLSPLVLAAAVGAAGPSTPVAPEADGVIEVSPLAAVAPTRPVDMTGPTVVAVAKAPDAFRVAAATSSAPPPAAVVSAPGALRIPAIALSAYRNAEATMMRAAPGCGISWNLLAGIGRIESGHANNGATDSRGTAMSPIYGPALDGTLPGNEVIVSASQLGRVTYARAMGPMQFLPGTWSRFASDGDGDGKADPQNVYDASLAAARYLCSGGLNLRDQSQVLTAILRYNNSMAYARNVLGWAASYATGVAPVNLPPITGPTPPIADARLDAHMEANPEGLGPGLTASDPLPVFSLTQSGVANQLPVPPGPAEGTMATPLNAPCTIFCISDNTPLSDPSAVPPWGAPAWTPPWMQPGWTPPWMQPPAPEAAPAPLAGPLPGGPAPGPVPAASPEVSAPQPAGTLPAPPVGVFAPAPGPAPAAPAPAGPAPLPSEAGAPAASLGPLPGPAA